MPTKETQHVVKMTKLELFAYLRTLGIADVPETAEVHASSWDGVVTVTWTTEREVTL